MENKDPEMNTSIMQSRTESILLETIFNDETSTRIAIKNIEESVRAESKQRMFNAPLTVEEKALFSSNISPLS